MTTPHETSLDSNAATYAQDFYAWCLSTAALVRDGHWDAIDPEALIEELESLGKSQHRELENRLHVLVMHLLKWEAQPPFRLTSPSWMSTIREQRRQIALLLRDSPSLRRRVSPLLTAIYPEAREEAVQEMGTLGPLLSLPAEFQRGGAVNRGDLPALADLLRLSSLPLGCPWSDAQVLDKDFWPGTP